MRRCLGVFGACMLLAAAVVGQPQAAAPLGKPYRPFTAKVRSTYVDEEGGEKRFSEWFFRRGNGSYAHMRETEAYDDERGIDRYVANTEERSFTHMSSFTKSAIVIVPDEQKFRSLLEEPGSCAWRTDGTWKRIGESEMLGIHIVEVEDKWSENLSMMSWVAPVLECFPLVRLRIDKGVVRTMTEVLSVEFGEPDPSAFRAPPGYVEMSPLEFEELWKKKYNGRRYYSNDEQALKVEHDYQAGKARSKRPTVK